MFFFDVFLMFFFDVFFVLLLFFFFFSFFLLKYRVMCLILTIQGIFLDFCLINDYILQWIFLIDMKPLQGLK